jgi:hypothetical protein
VQATIERVLPAAAGEYQQLLGRLREACELLSDAEYADVGVQLFEMFGGRIEVKPRADGSAALKLCFDIEPIVVAAKSTRYKLVAGDRLGNFLHTVNVPAYRRFIARTIARVPCA